MPFARAAGNRAVVAVDGRRFLLEPSTPDLLNALAYARISGIFPGLVADRAARAIYARLLDADDPLDLEDVEAVAAGYVEYVTGWPLPAACRLAAALERSWNVLDGHAAAEGIDLLALPAGRALNWIYARAVEGADYDEHDHPGARARLDRDLRAPLEALGLGLVEWEPIEGWAIERPDGDAPLDAAALARPLAYPEPAGFSAREQTDAFRSAMALVAGAGS